MSRPLGRSMPLNFADRADCVSEEYILSLENSALTEMPNQQTPNADATFTLTRATIDAITLGKTAFENEIAASNIQIQGNGQKLGELMSLLDSFEGNRNIVAP